MNEQQLILKANEWLDGLKGTRQQIFKKFTGEELIQIGKNLVANGR